MGDEGRVWVEAAERLGDAWKVRAVALIRPVMLALAWKRDRRRFDLTWNAVRAHIGLDAVVRMADPAREDLPPLIRFLLSDYLAMLPGYRKETGATQTQTTLDQHGYLQMQFVSAIGEVSSAYGDFLLRSDFDVGTAGG